MRLQSLENCRWLDEQKTGVSSQHIDLLQEGKVSPWLGLMSPARRRTNLRCRAGFAITVIKKTAAFHVLSSLMAESDSSFFRERIGYGNNKKFSGSMSMQPNGFTEMCSTDMLLLPRHYVKRIRRSNTLTLISL